MAPPLVDRSTGDIINSSDHNDIKDYIEDGTYRVNTLSLSVGGTEVISSARALSNITGDITQFNAGTLTVGRGGTGNAAWTQYLIPYAATTSSLSQIAIGTDGQVLTSGGAGVAPSFEDAGVDADVIDYLENQCEIIELIANNTLTPMTHLNMVSETFSDVTGYNNLVNTGNTTAYFSINKYKSLLETKETTEDSAKTTQSASYVLVKTIDLSAAPYVVTKHINQLKSYSGGGRTAACKIIWTYEDNSTNAVISSTTSTTYVSKTYINPDLTKAVKTVQVYLKVDLPGGYSVYEQLDEVWKAIVGTVIIEIDLPTITGTITATQIVANCPERETGDAVKYKLIDSASAEDDALAIDTKNALVNCDGTKITSGKIQIQLIAKVTSPTVGYPSCKTFVLKLFKS